MADGSDKHHSGPDHFLPLAEDGFAQIRFCGCDMVHLGVGPVTVRLSTEAFGGLAARIAEAQRQLERLHGTKAPLSLVRS